MTLNPSLIGSDLKKESRLQMITRNQWWGGNSKPYTTNMVSLEKRLGEKSLGEDQFVMGLMFLNERSNGGILSNSFFTGAIKYRNSLDASGNNVLSGAISGSYSNRMLDLENELKVADEFWDFLGGKNTYKDLLDCFERVGIELRDEIDAYFKRFNKN